MKKYFEVFNLPDDNLKHTINVDYYQQTYYIQDNKSSHTKPSPKSQAGSVGSLGTRPIPADCLAQSLLSTLCQTQAM